MRGNMTRGGWGDLNSPYAGVTLDQIPCGSPEDPLSVCFNSRGILRGSAKNPQEIWSSVTPALKWAPTLLL